MLIKKKLAILIASSAFFLSSFTHALPPQALEPVSGYARSFISGLPIAGATITILETGKKIKTNSNGEFGPIQYPSGKPITLVIEKWGYKTTQSGTIVVPRGGLNDPHHNITFQVPSIEIYYLLAAIIGASFDESKCHVVTTITAHDKTMDDVPQGEVDAKVRLTPFIDETPFYFDIFQSGPLKGRTNPFTRGLTKTSEDGGVAFYNLPARDEPYKITAEKMGGVFSEAQFLCRKGAFINISPPRGPMA